jgi:hypothetical protein
LALDLPASLELGRLLLEGFIVVPNVVNLVEKVSIFLFWLGGYNHFGVFG